MSKPEQARRARELRRDGRAIKAIARELAVSPGSVHLWCKDIQITVEQRQALDIPARSVQMAALTRSNSEKSARCAGIRQEAYMVGLAQVGKLSDRDKLLLGIGLYWGEGTKRDTGSVGIANMDPKALVSFIDWLFLLGIPRDRLRVSVQVAPTHDKSVTARWWSEVLSVNLAVVKVHWKVSPTSQYKTVRSDYHGVALVRMNNTKLKARIDGMLAACSGGS